MRRQTCVSTYESHLQLPRLPIALSESNLPFIKRRQLVAGVAISTTHHWRQLNTILTLSTSLGGATETPFWCQT